MDAFLFAIPSGSLEAHTCPFPLLLVPSDALLRCETRARGATRHAASIATSDSLPPLWFEGHHFTPGMCETTCTKKGGTWEGGMPHAMARFVRLTPQGFVELPPRRFPYAWFLLRFENLFGWHPSTSKHGSPELSERRGRQGEPRAVVQRPSLVDLGPLTSSRDSTFSRRIWAFATFEDIVSNKWCLTCVTWGCYQRRMPRGERWWRSDHVPTRERWTRSLVILPSHAFDAEGQRELGLPFCFRTTTWEFLKGGKRSACFGCTRSMANEARSCGHSGIDTRIPSVEAKPSVSYGSSVRG